MWIIGCDFHPSFEQIAFCNTDSGEYGQAKLTHANGAAESFYRKLEGTVRVGIEATGRTAWFERMLYRFGHELWVGDAARIRAAEVRKQKTDRRDAELLLRLMLEERFPRIWIPSEAERDRRQLVLHRHRLVQLRTRVKNQLQSMAIGEGVQRGKRLWSQAGRDQLQKLDLLPYTALRRDDLLQVLSELDGHIAPLDEAVRRQAEQDVTMQRLMTHPGVGPVVASAFVLTLGNAERFHTSKQVVSYLGLAPTEDSSAGHQRLGHISRQGNSLVRTLLVEAAHTAVRSDAEWKRHYLRMAMKRGASIALVAIARKLAVRLYWMWKTNVDYAAIVERGSHLE
jgi:transposase